MRATTWTSLPTIFKLKKNWWKIDILCPRVRSLGMFTNVSRDNNEIRWVESWSSARVLDKLSKPFFSEIKLRMEKFYSIFFIQFFMWNRHDSRLYHQLHDTLYTSMLSIAWQKSFSLIVRILFSFDVNNNKNEKQGREEYHSGSQSDDRFGFRHRNCSGVTVFAIDPKIAGPLKKLL